MPESWTKASAMPALQIIKVKGITSGGSDDGGSSGTGGGGTEEGGDGGFG